MHFLSYVFSMHKMFPRKKDKLFIVSSSTATRSTMSFDSTSTSSGQPLYVPPARMTDYAEMMDDENMAWGPSKPRRR